ncbi:hypothetical protein D3C73_1135350 [compost metagenome]
MLREAFLQHLQHDMHGGGGSRRGTQQSGYRTIGGTDHLRTELQRSFALWRILNDLYALTGDHDLPVPALRAGNEFAQLIHPLLA